jgi:RNA polymerase sigma factor (sigma-70 family)
MATMECAYPAATGEGDPGLVDDIGELYRSLSKSLERIVRAGVHAPEPVIEEACQFAWSRLVYHRDRVRRETALAWLTRTAVREAFKVTRRACRELSLDAAEPAPTIHDQLLVPCPAELVEQRDRLASLSSLPRRQQRVLWLRGLGLSYEEIAGRECCSARTVERQLFHARNRLRASEATH